MTGAKPDHLAELVFFPIAAREHRRPTGLDGPAPMARTCADDGTETNAACFVKLVRPGEQADAVLWARADHRG